MKALLLIAALATAPAWATPGDRTITFNVPVSLSNIDPAVTAYSVRCSVYVPGQATAVATAVTPFLSLGGSSINSQVSLGVTVPVGQIRPSGMTYECFLSFNNVPVTAGGQGMFFWSTVTPDSVVLVKDVLKP